MAMSIRHEHSAATDYRGDVSLNENGSSFIDPEAEQVWITCYYGGEIELAVPRIDMLINRDVGDKAEPFFVPARHHDVVSIGRASDQIGALYGRSC
jgi:hypothetical protein